MKKNETKGKLKHQKERKILKYLIASYAREVSGDAHIVSGCLYRKTCKTFIGQGPFRIKLVIGVNYKGSFMIISDYGFIFPEIAVVDCQHL